MKTRIPETRGISCLLEQACAVAYLTRGGTIRRLNFLTSLIARFRRMLACAFFYMAMSEAKAAKKGGKKGEDGGEDDDDEDGEDGEDDEDFMEALKELETAKSSTPRAGKKSVGPKGGSILHGFSNALKAMRDDASQGTASAQGPHPEPVNAPEMSLEE